MLISSILKNIPITKETQIIKNIDDDLFLKRGDIVVGKVLNDINLNCNKTIFDLEIIKNKNNLNATEITLHKLKKDDLIIGVLGEREATKSYQSSIPNNELTIGSIVQIVNRGGILGLCNSKTCDKQKPNDIQIIGYPDILLLDIQNQIPNISNFSIIPREENLKISDKPKNCNIFVFVGSNMDCGKTTALCKFIEQNKDKQIVSLKLTGAMSSRDSKKTIEYGSNVSYIFSDFGFESTANRSSTELLCMFYSMLTNAFKHKPDLIIIEMGDGLLGLYGVDTFFKDQKIKEIIDHIILVGRTPIDIWGGIQILDSWNLQDKIIYLTGPVVDNQSGIKIIKKNIINTIPCLHHNHNNYTDKLNNLLKKNN